MAVALSPSWRFPCTECPLQAIDAFRNLTPEELRFMSSFKKGELTVDAGTTLLSEGNSSAHLFTALSGWGFRYKLLEDGRRQILNFVLPGDLIGIQASLLETMQHSVEALTGMLLCVFERERIFELYREHPDLAFDITWLAAREEQMLDEHLLNVGQRTGEERTAYLLLFLYGRAEKRGLTRGGHIAFPFTQAHVADALGLSLVHTNRVLNRLARRKLIVLKKGKLELINRKGLAKLVEWEPGEALARPYL